MADDTARARETFVRELVARVAREDQLGAHDVIITPITSGGANYTSNLFLVTLKFKDSYDVHLFAKVAAVGEKIRTLFNATRLYYLEVFFYTKLLKIYRHLEIKKGISDEERFVSPKFFGSDSALLQEVVILEDLTKKGYGPYNRFESIDWAHATVTIDALAKFHALSFAYQKSNPEEFKKVCEDLVFMKPTTDGEESLKNATQHFIGPKLAILPESLRGRVVKALEKMGEDAMYKFRMPGDVTVISHGDYRASNLLYKYEGDKISAIVVDYQTIHAGCPVTDLIYYEMMGSDKRFRAEYHGRLVDHYHRQLAAALKRLDIDVDDVYPRAQMDKEYKERLPYSLLLAMVVLPVVLVEESQAPTLDGDSTFDNFILPPSEEYAKRYTDIVEDLVEWGLI